MVKHFPFFKIAQEDGGESGVGWGWGGMSGFLLYSSSQKSLVGDLFFVFESVCSESLSVIPAAGSAPAKRSIFGGLALGDRYAFN